MPLPALFRHAPDRSSRLPWLLSTTIAIGALVLPALAALAATGSESSKCHLPAKPTESSERTAPGDSPLHGIELVYRFDSGRTYRAVYAPDAVTFELLEPRLDPPPGKTMPYTVETLRPDLYLVVWTDPEFHTTFVLDLERCHVHASALRHREGLFVATAEILSLDR